MMEHTFRRITLKNGEHQKSIKILKFENPDYELLSCFFAAEAATFRKEILETLRPLREEEAEEASFSGNQYSFTVHNGNVVVYNDLRDPVEFCQLPLEDFLDLIDEWYEN